MCVIIDRKAGAEIPYDKLELACDINKHGFGFVWVENDRLKIERSLTDNDPKVVQKLLEDHKDKRVWLHLRHATVGDVILENSHPMIAATKDEDGQDVLLMHNGTLYDYKPGVTEDSKLSDTYFYNQRFISPLIKRCIPFGGLRDPFFQKQVGATLKFGMSVLLFVDNTGYVLRGNHDKGKEFEWGWASNDYSFNVQHNRSSQRIVPFHTAGFAGTTTDTTHQSTIFEYEDWWKTRKEKKKRTTQHFTDAWDEFKTATQDNTFVQDAIARMDFKAVSKKCKELWKVTEKSIEHDVKNAASLHPVPRKTFCELAEIKSLEEVLRLSREDFIDLCENHGVAMTELFIDVMAENRKLRNIQIASELKNGSHP